MRKLEAPSVRVSVTGHFETSAAATPPRSSVASGRATQGRRASAGTCVPRRVVESARGGRRKSKETRQHKAVVAGARLGGTGFTSSVEPFSASPCSLSAGVPARPRGAARHVVQQQHQRRVKAPARRSVHEQALSVDAERARRSARLRDTRARQELPRRHSAPQPFWKAAPAGSRSAPPRRPRPRPPPAPEAKSPSPARVRARGESKAPSVASASGRAVYPPCSEHAVAYCAAGKRRATEMSFSATFALFMTRGGACAWLRYARPVFGL